MKYIPIILVLSLLLTGCGRDAKLTKQIPGTWKHEKTATQSATVFTSTTTISSDGSFTYIRVYNKRPLTNAFAGTWQIRDGFLFMTLTNMSDQSPDMPAGSILKSRIIQLDDHLLISERDGMTNILTR